MDPQEEAKTHKDWKDMHAEDKQEEKDNYNKKLKEAMKKGDFGEMEVTPTGEFDNPAGLTGDMIEEKMETEKYIKDRYTGLMDWITPR